MSPDPASYEVEGPFGEASGYYGEARKRPVVEVKCITHRRNPIWNCFLSQFPPSESSLIKAVGMEATYYKFLRYDLGIETLVGVALAQQQFKIAPPTKLMTILPRR
jgi:UbiD family decarboxylase